MLKSSEMLAAEILAKPQENKEKIESIAIEKLKSFAEHPFKVEENEDMKNLLESIKKQGVLTPVLVRPDGNGDYEIISGHRRVFACRKLGLDFVPCIVKELSRDEAVVAMVDSNFHRERLLPSEKAFAYKMKMEALKHQGKSTLDTSRQLVGNSSETADIISDEESGRQVQRYIRLTYLIPELLQYVDDGKISLTPAVALSYLSEQQHFSCSNYKTDTRGTCETRHYVREDAIAQVVMMELQYISRVLEDYEDELIEALEKKTNADSIKEKKLVEAELQKAVVRNERVATLYEKLYEDNAEGKVTDEWFMQLSHKYEVERMDLKSKIADCKDRLQRLAESNRNKENFIAAIRKFMEMKEITPALLKELIEKIEVHETEGVGKNRTQRIFIHYRFVGCIEISACPKKSRYTAETRKGVAVNYLTA